MRRLLPAVALTVLVFLPGCGSPSSRVYDRDEFKSNLWGLSPGEVRTMVGSPDRITGEDAAPGFSTWRYNNKTRDPATGKIDRAAHVQFIDNKATDFDFKP